MVIIAQVELMYSRTPELLQIELNSTITPLRAITIRIQVEWGTNLGTEGDIETLEFEVEELKERIEKLEERLG